MTCRMFPRGLTIVLTLFLLISACASEDEIAATEAALEELEERLLARDEVTWASASYDRSTGFDSPSAITIRGHVKLDDEEPLQAWAETFLRETWESAIPRIGRISLSLAADDGTESLREPVVRRDELEGRFGPRDEG